MLECQLKKSPKYAPWDAGSRNLVPMSLSIPVVGVARVVDEGERRIGGAPDPPDLHGVLIVAAAFVLLCDDSLVGVEVGAAHEVVDQLGEEQLIVAQS